MSLSGPGAARRFAGGATAFLVAVGVLAGCSSAGAGDSAATDASDPPAATTSATVTGTPAAGPHNDADVAFATDMIPHHAQAVQMSLLASTQASNAQVKSLAVQIAAAQGPEISQMSGWLAGWGEQVPAVSLGSDGMSDMDHAGSGMMSAGDMAALADASGAAFDRMWVSMMIEHHTGAVEMATTEQADGENADAQALAATIVSTQQAEITTMQTLLSSLPAA